MTDATTVGLGVGWGLALVFGAMLAVEHWRRRAAERQIDQEQERIGHWIKIAERLERSRDEALEHGKQARRALKMLMTGEHK